MSLRGRLALGAAVAAAIAVLAVALFSYGATRRELHRNVDQALEQRAAELNRLRGRLRPGPTRTLPSPPLGAAGYAQIITAEGEIRFSSAGADFSVPVSERARAVAAGDAAPFFSDVDVSGTRFRVYTDRWTQETALQVARPLDEIDDVLRSLRWLLLGAAVVAVIVAGGLGLLASRATLQPVHRLTEAVEDVTATRDLSRRVDAHGDHELARLAESFNAMLGALDESVGAQRRLVADASHELRTPLTSLRTNIEVLAREGELSPSEREQLRRDVDAQLVELSALVTGVIDLARGEEPTERMEPVRLDQVVADAVEQAEFHYPGLRFEQDLEPSTVSGAPDRIALAVRNLLDNAGKWSPPDGVVEVTVRGPEITVRDHGPGVAPEDAPYVFERFWRAPAARDLPGSGLGLAIVQQVVERHGGHASVEAAEGGGARFRARFTPAS